jgi:uncharacterized protein (TIGR02271 family)
MPATSTSRVKCRRPATDSRPTTILAGLHNRLSRSCARRDNGRLEIPFDKDRVKSAPPGHVRPDHRQRDDPLQERLIAGTRTEQSGTARLRKYVVTGQQSVTVPVNREEVRLEREPITDGNVGETMDGPAISEEDYELTLHAERPVVTTEAVPVERMRLSKETVTE